MSKKLPTSLSLFGGVLTLLVLLEAGVYSYLRLVGQTSLLETIAILFLALLVGLALALEISRKRPITSVYYIVGVILGLFFAVQAAWFVLPAAAVILLAFWFGRVVAGIFAIPAVLILAQGSPEMVWLMAVTTILTLSLGVHFRRIYEVISFFLILLVCDVALRSLFAQGEMHSVFSLAGIDTLIVFLSFVFGVWIFENIFHKTFFLRLLELMSPYHKLTTKLKKQAQGTYHHSLLVATMASFAAEQVEGADPLLAQVGGQFHDVGKLINPKAFIENQTNEPKVTSRTKDQILGHVEQGVRVAKQYNLPKDVIEIIRTHQGDGVTGFYYTDLKNSKKDQRKLHIEDYCYPGPKPYTKEQVIVMLADSVEAAVRTRIRGNIQRETLSELVGEVIGRKFATHQLDDSPLDGNDLSRIRESFVDVLMGIYHARVDNE